MQQSVTAEKITERDRMSAGEMRQTGEESETDSTGGGGRQMELYGVNKLG